MASEQNITKPAKEVLVRARTRRIEIETPEGGPYVLRAVREIIVIADGAEVKRVDSSAPIRREFNPSGAGLDATELAVLGGLAAKCDAYAAADGESGAIAGIV